MDELSLAPPGAIASRPDTLLAPSDGDSRAQHGTLRARRLSIADLSLPLRLVIWTAIVQLLLCGVVLLLRDVLPSDLLVSGATDSGQQAITISPLSFILSYASLTLAWTFLLTGALRSPWYVRFGLLTLFTTLVFLAEVDVIPIPSSSTTTSSIGADTFLINSDFVTLLVLWVWALVVGIVNLVVARRGVDRRPSGHRFPWVTFLFALALVGTHFVVLAATSATTGDQSGPPLPKAFEHQVQFLFYLLIPVFFLSGSDYAEIGETLGAEGITRLRRWRSPGRIAALTAAAAVVTILYGALDLTIQYQAPFQTILLSVLAGGLLFAPIATGAARLLVAMGHIDRWSSRRIPYAVLVIGALLLVGAVVLALVLAAVAPFALVLLPLLGVPFLLRGRRRPGILATAGLFFMLVSTAGILAFLKLYGLLVQVAIPGIELLVAPATLTILLWLALRRRINEQTADLIVQLFALIVGLQIITWFFDLVVGVRSFSDSVVVAAVALIGAQLWDLLMSGEQVTNINGRRFPRNARILLYAGYVMLGSTLALYFSSQKGRDPFAAGFLNSDNIALFGLALLGVPLVVTTFILVYGRWHTQNRIQQREPQAALIPAGVTERT